MTARCFMWVTHARSPLPAFRVFLWHLTGTVTAIDSDVTASSNASYYKMTIKPDATCGEPQRRQGGSFNGMSVTARVEYDQVTYFEYAMEALGVLFP